MTEEKKINENMSDEKKDGDFLTPFTNIVRAGVAMMVIGAAMDVLSKTNYTLKIHDELKQMVGEDFFRDCLLDDECKKVVDDIVNTSLYWDTIGPKEERKRQREKVLSILAKKLKELKIDMWCIEKDLGELGTLYEKCVVEFMGETFDVEEVHGKLLELG